MLQIFSFHYQVDSPIDPSCSLPLKLPRSTVLCAFSLNASFLIKICSGSDREKIEGKGRISEDYDREMDITNKVKEGLGKHARGPLIQDQVKLREFRWSFRMAGAT